MTDPGRVGSGKGEKKRESSDAMNIISAGFTTHTRKRGKMQ